FASIQSSSWRWHIQAKQIHRWGDVSTLLIVLLLVQVYFIQPTDQPMFVLLKCLPVLLAPVLLAQLLSQQAQIPLSTLFYTLRKKHRTTNKTIDFQLPYAAITVLSAGAANVQTAHYFILATLFFIGVLWTVRPQQSRVYLWLPVIALAVALSYIGQKGLRQLHNVVEQKSIQWLSDWNADPFKNQTSIGDIGELKLSSQIEFRLKADGQILLHQASYDRYLGQAWIASKRIFTAENSIVPIDKQPLKKLEILQHPLQNTVLSLPDGTVNITGLDDAVLQSTELGAVKIDIPPRTANYQVFYTGKRISKPSRYDLQIPPQHSDWLQTVSRELKLAGLPPKVAADRLKDYFQQHFFYSLYLGTETDPDQALRDFMLKRKAGHCEYFAAATVLLLRQNGIPARLATGYSVSEYIPESDLYLVRRRDAHAWAIAYLNGIWQPVDSTPAQWQTMEADNANGVWQTLSDAWSNSLFKLQQWKISETQGLMLKIVGVLVLILYLATRLFNSKHLARLSAKPIAIKPICTGLDSEFYQLEQRLQNTQQARFDNESLQHWVERLASPELTQLCQLHYQLRFDPKGISAEKRELLRQRVNVCLSSFQ
ncbi:MAG: transglutaminase family protein, partial [Methylococcaceae bacterium]|nr:transglutaminase family protein [Methylococcaceae bacterium]